MESIDTLLIFLFLIFLFLLVVIVIVATACVVILSGSRKPRSTADEARRKPAEEELHCDAKQQTVRRLEEEEQREQLEQEKYRRIEEEGERLEEEAQQKAETQRQIIEELQKAEEEQRRLEDEAQRKGEELHLAVEEHRRPEEESERLEETPRREDKTQHKGAEDGHLEVEAEGKRLEPGKRGGRPRASTKAQKKPLAQKAEPCRPKSEIICWKKERQWIPAVEVPEELLEGPNLVVLQNGLPLIQDESREGCWHLKDAYGQVVVQWKDEVEKDKIELGEKRYLLFTLSGQDRNQGRRVKSPSYGSYLVMVPDNWDRDDTLSGPPPVAPEPTSLPGYQAHFFELEKEGDKKIAFRPPTGKSIEISSKAPQFELIGNRLWDASEKMGPLFGESPPQIRVLDDQTWKDVGTIVVGEEGGGRGRWRKRFSPIPGETQQNLPSEVSDRKGGWYFLRFYDAKDDLIESLDFRFISALKQINIPQSSPLPSEDGHEPARVEFRQESGCAVQPADGLTNVQIERQDDKTTLTIPPDPIYDETRWLVGPEGGPQVEVTILIERLWWIVGEGHNAPSEWKDLPLTLTREDFLATSKKALWLRLPRRRWVDKVLVGFEHAKARAYNVRVTDNTITVPLREFCDSQEVSDRTQDHCLKVWIERDGKPMDTVVAVIPASVVAPERGPVVSPPPAHYVGLGRKKTAVAKAVLQPGSGDIKVNGCPLDDYFKETPGRAKPFLRRLLELKQVRETLSHMDVLITVTESSPSTTRQAKAVAHAIACALMSYDPKLKPLLKQAGFGGSKVKSFQHITGGLDEPNRTGA